VFLDTPVEARSARLIRREGEQNRDDWNARWEEGEQWYFTRVMPPAAFDLVIEADEPLRRWSTNPGSPPG
jgi:hypothetical protein